MTNPTTEELKDLLGKVTPDWRCAGKHMAIISEGNTGWDKPSEIYGYGGHMVCESVKHPAIKSLIIAAPTLARKVIAAEKLVEALKGMFKAYREPDKQLCCNGYMCGCRGASERDYADYWAAEAIKAWEDAE